MVLETSNSLSRKRNYWFFLLGLFILSLLGGVYGFHIYFLQNNQDYDWLRCLYRAFELFSFEGGDLAKPLPLELHIARFTAPLTTIMAIIITLLDIFKEQWINIRIALLKNHVIIIGLGTKGKNVLEENLQKKNKVLVIEKNPLNPYLTVTKSKRCLLIQGEATDINTLKKARIKAASIVYLLMGDDTRQVNTCLLLYQLILDSHRDEYNALPCIMHLRNQEFLTILRNHKLVKDVHDGLELNIFNIFENSARELFEVFPPDRSLIRYENKRFVQIIIFGFGNAGEALALQTAFAGHYINGEKPKVIVYDLLAKQKESDFLNRYNTYKNYCELKFYSFEANSPNLIHNLMEYQSNPDAITTIVICFDNKTQNLLLGLKLENLNLMEDGEPVPIFIRTNDNESVNTLSTNIRSYGLYSRVCSREIIEGGMLDDKAKSIHKHYLETRKDKPDFGKKEADSQWEALSQEYKDSNRKAADHIGIKMRSIGCEIVEESDPRPAAVFTIDELEQLGRLEHARWCAERSLTGWVPGETEDSKGRRTPYLVSWENLKEDIKDIDKQLVTSIPGVLENVKMKVVRQ